MYELQLEWKEHSINLSMIEAKLRAEQPSYVGCSADSKLRLHFSEALASEAEADLVAYWESLDEESEEAVAYKSRDQLMEEAELKKELAKQVKLASLSKSWDQMSELERKLCMNLEDEVSLEELQALQE